MAKLDLTKEYKSYYSAKPIPELMEVEPAQYLSISGTGDPSGDLFAQRIKALYTVAYPLKFKCKALDQDFTVAKLEGLWWFDKEKYQNQTLEEAPLKIPRQDWHYRLLIRLPDFISETFLNTTIQEVSEKKIIPFVKETEWFQANEGKVVQMLHVGPFSKEPETLLKMHQYMQAHSLQHNGLHHEIYLSDFNKTAPEKLKTILREPVKQTV